MPIFTEQVRQHCIGEKCSEQTFLFKIDEQFISIPAFIGAVRELAEENQAYTEMLGLLVQLETTLSSIADITREDLSEEEKKIIKNIISKPTTLEIYVILHSAVISKYYTLQEFIEIYETKMAGAKTTEDKAKYSNRMVKAVMASKLLQRINKSIHQMTPEERAARGYDLTEEERIQKNLNILKGNFKEGAEDVQLTVGRHYSVPGMIQCHQIFAIDTLTGTIFVPKDVERFASFFTAAYQQQEKDAITLDYIYAVPKNWKEQIVTMPEGYTVFPLALEIYPKDNLSAEANKIITETEIQLFTPCLADIDKAKRRVMNPKTVQALLELYEKLKEHTE